MTESEAEARVREASRPVIHKALEHLHQTFDEQYGGFGRQVRGVEASPLRP